MLIGGELSSKKAGWLKARIKQKLKKIAALRERHRKLSERYPSLTDAPEWLMRTFISIEYQELVASAEHRGLLWALRLHEEQRRTRVYGSE